MEAIDTGLARQLKINQRAAVARLVLIPAVYIFLLISHLLPWTTATILAAIFLAMTIWLFSSVRHPSSATIVGYITTVVEAFIISWTVIIIGASPEVFAIALGVIVLAHVILEGLINGLIVATIASVSYGMIILGLPLNETQGQALASLTYISLALYGLTLLVGLTFGENTPANMKLVAWKRRLIDNHLEGVIVLDNQHRLKRISPLLKPFWEHYQQLIVEYLDHEPQAGRCLIVRQPQVDGRCQIHHTNDKTIVKLAGLPRPYCLISDPQGQPLENVLATIYRIDKSATKTVKSVYSRRLTTSDGRLALHFELPGHFEIVAEKSGYKTSAPLVIEVDKNLFTPYTQILLAKQ